MSRLAVLFISLGQQMLSQPDVRARQAAYTRGMDAVFVLLGPGERRELCENGVRYLAPGGASKAGALWNGIRTARTMLRKTRFDLISAEDPSWTGLVAWLSRLGKRVPFQLQDHSGRFARSAGSMTEMLLWPLARFLARQATRIRTVSERGRDGLERIGISTRQIDVLPVPVRVPRRLPQRTRSSEVLRVLSVGRLEPEKGFVTLLHEWKKAALPRAELVIVGDGRQRGELERLAKTLGITDSVMFRGALAAEGLWQEYANADLYIQHSLFEGWGRTLFEAAWAGLPIISIDVGLVGEVLLPGRDLLVCEWDNELNVTSASMCLRELIADPEKRARLASGARKAAEEYLAAHSYDASVEAIQTGLRRAAGV